MPDVLGFLRVKVGSNFTSEEERFFRDRPLVYTSFLYDGRLNFLEIRDWISIYGEAFIVLGE